MKIRTKRNGAGLETVKAGRQEGSGERWTVIWAEEWVWVVRSDRAGRLLDYEVLPGLECTAKVLRKTLQIMGRRRGRDVMRWVVLLEGTAGETGGGGEDFLMIGAGAEETALPVPEWLRACWGQWRVEEWPESIGWGPGLLEASVRRRWREGGAVDLLYCTLGGRALLLGCGDGAGFQRLGRREVSAGPKGGIPAEDWLRQSMYLFSQHTGRPPKNVWCPEGEDVGQESLAAGEMLILVGDPHEEASGRQSYVVEIPWVVRELAGMEDVAGAPVGGVAAGRLAEARGRWKLLASGTMVLGLTLLLLVTGACRGPGAAESGMPHGLQPVIAEAEQERHRRLVSLESRKRVERDLKREPFRLISALARSVPEEVAMDRIHVVRDGENGLALRLEGRTAGAAPSPQFRGWVQELEQTGHLEQLDSLEMKGGASGLGFVLEGRGAAGGKAR